MFLLGSLSQETALLLAAKNKEVIKNGFTIASTRVVSRSHEAVTDPRLGQKILWGMGI
jgi:hypothetical protein